VTGRRKGRKKGSGSTEGDTVGDPRGRASGRERQERESSSTPGTIHRDQKKKGLTWGRNGQKTSPRPGINKKKKQKKKRRRKERMNMCHGGSRGKGNHVNAGGEKDKSQSFYPGVRMMRGTTDSSTQPKVWLIRLV